MHRFVRGLVSNRILAAPLMSSPKFHSPVQSQTEMLGRSFSTGGDNGREEDGEGNAVNGGSCCGQNGGETVEPLLLLIQATQVNGQPLPIGSFTARTVATIIQHQTGYFPIDVDVMTDRDAIIEMEPDVRVGEVAQHLHGIREWDGQQADISCLLSTRGSVINVVHERENGRARLQQLEEEQKRVRDEQQHHQEQLEKFLMQFKEEVKKVEKLQQPSEEEAAGIGAWGGPREPKSVKPPSLPPFSGADPVPKDEASCEQWVWLAKEALKSCIVGAVRIAIIQSVRGEVREFVAAVGFEASIEALLAKVEDRFGEKWTTDRLQQEFYQITQEKGRR